MKYRIGREMHRLNIRIARQLEKECPIQNMQDVTGANGRIIRYLAEHEGEEVYQKDLEKAFGITRSTASRVVGLMEQKGLVDRVAVAHDARLKRVMLTDRSRAISKTMCAVGRMIDDQLLRGFNDEEKEQLLVFLERMGKNLD